MVGDREAVCRGRPQRYVDHEEAEIKRTAAVKDIDQPVLTDHVEWSTGTGRDGEESL